VEGRVRERKEKKTQHEHWKNEDWKSGDVPGKDNLTGTASTLSTPTIPHDMKGERTDDWKD
jgi:hypothetical protein